MIWPFKKTHTCQSVNLCSISSTLIFLKTVFIFLLASLFFLVSSHWHVSLSLTESGLCFIWAGKYQIKRRVLKEALNCGNRAAVVVKQMNVPCDQREREGEVEEADRSGLHVQEIWFVSHCIMTVVTRCGDNCIPGPEVSCKRKSTNRESKSKLCWWSDLTTAVLANGRSGLSLHSGMLHRCSLFLMCVTELERDFLGYM